MQQIFHKFIGSMIIICIDILWKRNTHINIQVMNQGLSCKIIIKISIILLSVFRTKGIFSIFSMYLKHRVFNHQAIFQCKSNSGYFICVFKIYKKQGHIFMYQINIYISINRSVHYINITQNNLSLKSCLCCQVCGFERTDKFCPFPNFAMRPPSSFWA